MLEVWKLKRQIQSVQRSYAQDRAELQKKKEPQNELGQLDADEYGEVREIEKEIDWIISTRLCQEARSLDVETPPRSNEEMWSGEYGVRIMLTPKGRAHVRKLIHEENTRRFEAKSRWIPLLSVILAIIGALISLVALTVQRKSADAAQEAAAAAQTSVDLTRKQMEGIGAAIVEMPHGISVDFPVPPSGEVRTNLMNNGHVIAHDIHLSLSLLFQESGQNGRERQIFSKKEAIPAILPTAVITRPDFIYPFELSREEYERVLGSKAYMIVRGSFDYENGFGKKVGPHQFCYAYLWGNNKFGRWIGDCADIQTELRLARELASQVPK